MNHMFQTDLKKRKSYLKTIAKNNRSWPFRWNDGGPFCC